MNPSRLSQGLYFLVKNFQNIALTALLLFITINEGWRAVDVWYLQPKRERAQELKEFHSVAIYFVTKRGADTLAMQYPQIFSGDGDFVEGWKQSFSDEIVRLVDEGVHPADIHIVAIVREDAGRLSTPVVYTTQIHVYRDYDGTQPQK